MPELLKHPVFLLEYYTQLTPEKAGCSIWWNIWLVKFCARICVTKNFNNKIVIFTESVHLTAQSRISSTSGWPCYVTVSVRYAVCKLLRLSFCFNGDNKAPEAMANIVADPVWPPVLCAGHFCKSLEVDMNADKFKKQSKIKQEPSIDLNPCQKIAVAFQDCIFFG